MVYIKIPHLGVRKNFCKSGEFSVAKNILLEYARYVMGKNIANTGETDQVNFDKEFKAVTMASIMGRRMGFKMDDPRGLADNQDRVFSWDKRTESPERLLSDSVNKANKALFQISREFFKSREQQKDLTKTIGKSK